jgi:transposase-like protein
MGDERQQDPGTAPEVITGEVVYQPTRSGGDPGSSRWGKRERFGNRSNYNVFVDENLVREVHSKWIQGWSYRKISEEYGMSPETARRWCGEARETRRQAGLDIVALRAEAAAHLEAARMEAWKIHGEAVLHKTQLDALGKVETLTGAHARLMGLNAPVRVDLQVTELTAAEQELQEMINEAKAKTATDEAAVIQAASEDPDL